MGPYGGGGKAYMNWCASMADSLSIGVPWIMCQQPDAPQPMVFSNYLHLNFLLIIYSSLITHQILDITFTNVTDKHVQRLLLPRIPTK